MNNINNSIYGMPAYKQVKSDNGIQEKKDTAKNNFVSETLNNLYSKDTNRVNGISQKNEDKLSDKAKEYLDKLREEYGEYDIMIGNSTDDLKTLSKSGNKEFSIIFSSAEIERMANDEKYAGEKMDAVAGAIRMARRIAEENGYKFSPADENMLINKIGVVVDDKGSMKLFAELEKNSAKQKERLEDSKSDEVQEPIGRKNPYGKEEKPVIKRTTVEAYSVEELLDRIDRVDWDKVPEGKAGDRVNYYV